MAKTEYDGAKGAGSAEYGTDAMARFLQDMNSLSGAESSMSQALESVESFRDRYVEAMDSMATGVGAAIKKLTEGGFKALTNATKTLVSGQEGAAKAFGKAMLQMTAEAMLAIGEQAAIKAVFALAEGLLFKDPTAIAAAGLYAEVAAASLAVGAAMSVAASSMSTSSNSNSSSSSSSSSAGSSSASSAETTPGINININVQGHIVDTRAFVEDYVAPALAEAVGKGVANSGQYNLVATKD